jgi:hypothetical protein
MGQLVAGQVVEALDEVELASAIGGAEAVEAELSARQGRQLAWLKRGRAESGDQVRWVPRKKHRGSARRWVLLVDNAVPLKIYNVSLVG